MFGKRTVFTKFLVDLKAHFAMRCSRCQNGLKILVVTLADPVLQSEGVTKDCQEGHTTRTDCTMRRTDRICSPYLCGFEGVCGAPPTPPPRSPCIRQRREQRCSALNSSLHLESETFSSRCCCQVVPVVHLTCFTQ